jgi:ribonuclease VapC
VSLVVDTSAIIALMVGEPEAATFDKILGGTVGAAISVGSMIESCRVLQIRAGIGRWHELDELVDAYAIRIMAVDEPQLRYARDGMARFGQGRGAPPAVLNFGDLFAYALARSLNAPLLFKGEDFSQTDVIAAWRP